MAQFKKPWINPGQTWGQFHFVNSTQFQFHIKIPNVSILIPFLPTTFYHE